jgi:hypothetical protein
MMVFLLFKRRSLIDPLSFNDLKVLKEWHRIEPQGYWEEHVNFETALKNKNRSVGEEFINRLIINAWIPLLFAYGSVQGRSELCDRSLDWLEQLPKENNKLLRMVEDAGIITDSALESQAAIAMLRLYCGPKKCVQCAIGHQLLKKPLN